MTASKSAPTIDRGRGNAAIGVSRPLPRVPAKVAPQTVHDRIVNRKLTRLQEGQMAVYGYVRVSTDRQADDGESLGTQQRIIEGYAMMNALTLDRIFVERGVSGSKQLGERAEGTRLLAALKAE